MAENDLNMFDDLLEDPVQTPPVEGDITQDPEPPVVPEPEPIQEPSYEGNVMYQFLQQRGISDPTKIKFENENGDLEDYDFNSLTPEEQLTILSEITDPGLTEHETEVINYLRKNQVSFDQVVDYFAQQKLDAYLKEHPDQVKQKTYQIDDYSNEELYLADLKSKYPSFTDEELLSKLNVAKENDELFTKEVELLRTQYKEAEEEQIRWEQQRADQSYQDLQNNLIAAASNFKEFSLDYTDKESDSIEIEDADRQAALNYLLQQDSEGKSQLIRDLEDPNELIMLAWYKLFGRDVVSNVTRYWKDTLKAERKENAKLRSEIESLKSKSNVVPKQTEQQPVSIESLWGNIK